MSFGVYKQIDSLRPQAVRRNGKPVLFGNKKAAKDWLKDEEPKLLETHIKGTEFFVCRRIKRTDGTKT